MPKKKTITCPNRHKRPRAHAGTHTLTTQSKKFNAKFQYFRREKGKLLRKKQQRNYKKKRQKIIIFILENSILEDTDKKQLRKSFFILF